MKRLYRTVLDRGAPSSDQSNRPPAGSTNEAIAAAERAVGAPLPKTFKRFAKEVGGTTWPIEIFSVETIAALAADPLPGRPVHLVAFAADGRSNHWHFDVRARPADEYPIVFWDHAHPTADPAPETATSFDGWLEEQVNAHVARNESQAFTERLGRIEEAIAPRRDPAAGPPPSAEDVTAVEAVLRFTLPKDYVGFITRIGTVKWPLEILDVRELERLTEALRTRFGAKARGVVAFGREPEGAFVAFDRRGKLVAFGDYPIEDATFFDFVERRIRERSGAAPPVPSDPDSVAPTSVPYGIVEDEWINSVWRAVAKASRHTIAKAADGRLEVSVEDFQGGKRRMFVDEATWRTIEEHLGRLRK